MSPRVIAVDASESVNFAACELHRRGVRRLFVLDRSRLVDVDHGVVTLTGTVERRSEVEIAGRLTGTVPGVVQVHNTTRRSVSPPCKDYWPPSTRAGRHCVRPPPRRHCRARHEALEEPMTTLSDHRKPIVVGVDGSAAALA
ncbi:BON domain-containing protein, partial [Kibdelosporangium lantanae]